MFLQEHLDVDDPVSQACSGDFEPLLGVARSKRFPYWRGNAAYLHP